jgi:hypothetical protein
MLPPNPSRSVNGPPVGCPHRGTCYSWAIHRGMILAANLAWYWVVLGLDPTSPLPVVTRAWLKSLRDERKAKLRSAGAGIYELVRVGQAFEMARRHVVDGWYGD